MSWANTQDAIITRFSANTTVPAANIAWDGFNGPTFNPPDSAVWVRPSITAVPEAVARLTGVTHPGPLGLGTLVPTYREGMIIVQHFAPRGSGQNTVQDFVDLTNAIFHRQSFGASPVVVCRDADEPIRTGFDPSDEYFQINAVIPFYYLDS